MHTLHSIVPIQTYYKTLGSAPVLVSPVLNSVSVASSPELHKEVAPSMGLF